jgi:serine/threonine protein kinase/predicted Zn-dependent protease
MPDETIDQNPPKTERAPRPSDHHRPATDEFATVVGQDAGSRADEPANTLIDHFPDSDSNSVSVSVSDSDSDSDLGSATIPAGPPHPAVKPPGAGHAPPALDARAAETALGPKGGSAPPGAFDKTEVATAHPHAFDSTEVATIAPDRRIEPPDNPAFAETRVMTGDGTETKEWTAEDFIPPQRRCGNYVLKQFFAKGGMGEVWLADDPVIGRSVALKKMLSDRPDQRQRFRVEAQITGQLEHPGIVPVHELGANEGGEPYYVMKFVEGRTLSKVIKEFHDRKLTGGEHELELVKLLQMFISLCQTVAYAHAHGVLHRDLKPDNVMLGPFGETILLDWGIAKVLGQKDPEPDPVAAAIAAAAAAAAANPATATAATATATTATAATTTTTTATGTTTSTSGYDSTSRRERLRRSIPESGTVAGSIVGTPSYMAPEVAAGLTEEIDERSDIFLLGSTLYQILSGRQPRTGKSFGELIMKAAYEPPEPVRKINPVVPKALDAICQKAMAHEKTKRYQTATELAEELQRFIAGEPVSAYRESLPARAWRWARRHRRALGISAAAALIATTVLFAALKVRDAEKRRALAALEASRLKAMEKARVDLKTFRHLADEANFFAATTNPASEHAPYFDPRMGAAMARAALGLARSWGPALEALPLQEERTAVKSELHDLLILAASETLRAAPGREAGKESLATLDRAERLGGPSISAFRLRATAHEQLGDNTQAAAMRQRAEDPKTPRTATDLFLLGERERDESAARVGGQTDLKPWQLDPARMEKAISFYRQALAIDPDHFWARFQVGRCLQTLGRFPEAAEVLGGCIAIRPKAPWGYSALGLALAEQGRFDEAERMLNQAIGLDPDARAPRLHRGFVYWRQKKYNEAVADFEAVLAPPHDQRLFEAAYFRGQLYLERGEVDKALDDYTRVVIASPGFRSVYLDRPLIYLAKGDTAHALADLDTYVSLVRKVDPGGWEIHGLRGRLLRFLYSELPQEKRRGPTGQTMLQLALTELARAVQMGGKAVGLFDDLGAVLEHAGRLDQAIAAYTRGIESAPEFAKLRIKRAWAWELLNQHEKAAADFAAAAQAAPENAEAHTGLGYIQALRKLPADAQREADLALLHSGDEYLVLHNVACIYATLAQTEGAQASAFGDVSIALLRKALKLWGKAATGPNELDLIKAEPAFKPIQGRTDFQELLQTKRDPAS